MDRLSLGVLAFHHPPLSFFTLFSTICFPSIPLFAFTDRVWNFPHAWLKELEAIMIWPKLEEFLLFSNSSEPSRPKKWWCQRLQKASLLSSVCQCVIGCQMSAALRPVRAAEHLELSSAEYFPLFSVAARHHPPVLCPHQMCTLLMIISSQIRAKWIHERDVKKYKVSL